MFKFKEGYSLSGVDQIHEAYHVLRNGMWGNISADRIVKLAAHFLRLQKPPVFFFLQLPCSSDEEAEQNAKGSRGEHVKVYYVDNLKPEEALVMLAGIRKILIRDGMVEFGFGAPDPNTELCFDRYNLFRILTEEVPKYEQMLQELGLPQEEHVLNAWDIIDEQHPGICRIVKYKGQDIFDLPKLLDHWGIYLDEIRPVDEEDEDNEDVEYRPIQPEEQKDMAEIMLTAGAKEYQQGHFAEALNYYKEAAELGNVTALSNLGYCYYYGRSVPVDYKLAAAYFDKAASLGDACAMYKLGDMVEKKLLRRSTTACDYYVAAYNLASRDKDPESYPDVCLRLARYDKEHREYFLLEAVKYFKIRLEAGDNFTDGVLRRAERELAQLQAEKKN